MALYELRALRLARGAREVLALPALDIDEGVVTALLGPNGAGKSTLLEALAGLLAPAGGVLRYDGAAVDDGTRASLVRRVGYVAQQPWLFERSVRANVELGLRLRGMSTASARPRVDEALQCLGLTALAARPARQLSGGETQRVALARALALAPEVLLLDEPFSALDATSAADLKTLLRGFRALGLRAVVFATHDEKLALALAEVTLRLADGHAARDVRANVFAGTFDPAHHCFLVDGVAIHVGDHVTGGTRVAIDPAHVVLSTVHLESSMRNAFDGRVVTLTEQGGEVMVTVAGGLPLQALVTHETVAALGLVPGRPVWASFKSNAVRVY